jgi:hypothetical protein
MYVVLPHPPKKHTLEIRMEEERKVQPTLGCLVLYKGNFLRREYSSQ